MAARSGNWKKDKLTLENGVSVEAQFPEVVSASRSTDIPAFYCDWFFHRLRVGYSAWTNPFNGAKSYVAYRDTRFIVFWSKNPHPLLEQLPYLKERNIGCYVQYSLNDYDAEGLEKNVPPLKPRIETFKKLVAELGKGGVVWRFDPLVLTDDISTDTLLDKIENIGDQLYGYTEKLVFSFADIAMYRKVRKNLNDANIPYHEWTNGQMVEFAKRLVELNQCKGWNYRLATCGEAAALEGIEHNHCIDDDLMIQRAYEDDVLMDFLGVSNSMFGEITLPNGRQVSKGNNRDKGQREFCGCMKAKDIGQYNTCIHKCEYCYANDNKAIAKRNYQSHLLNPHGETITET